MATTTVLRHTPESLDFGRVALHDAHVLTTLDLYNGGSDAVKVELVPSPGLNRSITFQLENENLEITDIADANQLYNIIGLIDEVRIDAGETVTVIVGFNPAHGPELMDPPDTPNSASSISPSTNAHNSFFDVAGANNQRSASADEASYQFELVEGWIYIHTRGLGSYASIAATPDTSMVKVLSEVCLSVMHVESENRELSFEDCIVNRKYSHEVQVRNQSEIPLTFTLNSVTVANIVDLEIVDDDLGEVFTRQTLPAFGRTVLRVGYSPTEVGEVMHFFRLTNLYDSENTVDIKVSASVTAGVQEAVVRMNPLSVDFGECYIGQAYRQAITLLNLSQEPIELDLVTGVSPEVTFHIITGMRSVSESESDSSSTNNVAGGRQAQGAGEWQQEEGSRRRVMSSTIMSGENMCRELSLAAGRSRQLTVVYRPKLSALSERNEKEGNANRLTKSGFHVHVHALSKAGLRLERRTLRCQAQLCLSMVELSASHLNFGNVNVGSAQTKIIQVRNMSELQADVRLKSGSRILSCSPQTLSIPPRQRADVSIKIIPVNVNPDFKKTVMVENLCNQDNTKMLNVTSSNIDDALSAQSLFSVGVLRPAAPRVQSLVGLRYRSTQFAESQSTIFFGDVVVNNPTVQRFWVKSSANKPISLELHSSENDMKLYVIKASKHKIGPFGTAIMDTPNTLMNDKAMEKRDNHDRLVDTIKRQFSSAVNRRSITSAPAWLDLASPWVDPRDKPKRTRGADMHGISFADAQHTTNATRLDSKPLHGSAMDLVELLRDDGRSSTDKSSSEDEDGGLEQLPLALLQRRQVKAMPAFVRRPSRGASVDARFVNDNIGADILKTPSKQIVGAGAGAGAGAGGGGVGSANASGSVDVASGNLNNGNSNGDGVFGSLGGGINGASGWKTPGDRKGGGFGKISAGIADTTASEIDKLMDSLEKFTLFAPVFASAEEEESFVLSRIKARDDLNRAIARGLLVSATDIQVMPGGKQTVYAVLVPTKVSKSAVGHRRVKGQRRITINLVKHGDEELPRGPRADGPRSRFIAIRFHLCTSMLDVPQKHVRFGMVKSNAVRSKVLLLSNGSEVPMLFNIRKTGSVASGAMTFVEGLAGVIRPYRTKEIAFTFKPRMAGTFEEKLIVENVLDGSNTQAVQLRAVVTAPQTYALNLSELDFGEFAAGEKEWSTHLDFIISNTSSRVRTFQVSLDRATLQFQHFEITAFIESVGDESIILTQEADEEIEKQVQRLKIATRKKQEKKQKKIKNKLRLLRAGLKKDDAYESDASDTSEDEGPSAEQVHGTNKIKLEIQPRRRRRVQVTLQATAISTLPDVTVCERSYIKLLVREPTNKENTKVVVVRACVWRSTEAQFAAEKRRSSTSSPDSSGGPKSPPRIMSPAHAVVSGGHTAEGFGSPPGANGEGIMSDSQVNPMFIPPSPTGFVPRSRLSGGASIGALNESGDPSAKHASGKGALSSGSGVGGSAIVDLTSVDASFEVVPSSIDFGAAELSQSHSSSFVIRNTSNHSFVFALFSSSKGQGQKVVQFKVLNGAVPAHGQQEVPFTFTPVSPGHQKFTITIKDIKGGASRDFTVNANPRGQDYLRFVDCPLVDGTAKLQAGACYWQTTADYVKVVPLTIESISSDRLTLSSSSTMQKQVFIFADKELEVPCNNVAVEPHSQITVYICLRPRIPDEVLRSAECRIIEAGIHFHVSHGGMNNTAAPGSTIAALSSALPSLASTSSSAISMSIPGSGAGQTTNNSKTATLRELSLKAPPLLARHTVKFSAVVGRSSMKVPRKVIKLDSSKTIGREYSTSFIVRNPSTHLPLTIAINAPPDVDISTASETVQPKSTCKIEVKCYSQHYGLQKHRIQIINEYDKKHPVEVSVLVFVDEDLLRSDLPFGSETVIRYIDFGLAYLAPVDPTHLKWDGRTKIGIDSLLSLKDSIGSGEGRPVGNRRFVLRNTSSMEMTLVPKADCAMRVWYEEVRGQDGFVVDLSETQQSSAALFEDSQFIHRAWSTHTCGPNLMLAPYASCTVVVQCPLPGSLTYKKFDLLNSGTIVNFSGSLHFERDWCVRPSRGPRSPSRDGTKGSVSRQKTQVADAIVVKVFDVKVQYCISRGTVSPDTADLGVMGYLNSWGSRSFDFTVHNKSKSNMCLAIGDLPDMITLDPSRKFVKMPINSSDSALTAASSGGIGGLAPLTEEVGEDGAGAGLESEESGALLSAGDGTSSSSKGSPAGEKTVVTLSKLLQLEPGQSAVLKCIASADSTEKKHGPRTITIPIANLLNPTNPLNVNVNLVMTVFGLTFENLNDDGSLHLPPLHYPVAAPCDEWFSVRSTQRFEDASIFSVFFEPEPELAAVATIELQLRSSNVPIDQFDINEDVDARDLRVCVTLRKDVDRMDAGALRMLMDLGILQQQQQKEISVKKTDFGTFDEIVPATVPTVEDAGADEKGAAPSTPGSAAALQKSESIKNPVIQAKFGNLCFRALHSTDPNKLYPIERVAICGSVMEVRSFEVTPNRLQLTLVRKVAAAKDEHIGGEGESSEEEENNPSDAEKDNSSTSGANEEGNDENTVEADIKSIRGNASSNANDGSAATFKLANIGVFPLHFDIRQSMREAGIVELSGLLQISPMTGTIPVLGFQEINVRARADSSMDTHTNRLLNIVDCGAEKLLRCEVGVEIIRVIRRQQERRANPDGPNHRVRPRIIAERSTSAKETDRLLAPDLAVKETERPKIELRGCTPSEYSLTDDATTSGGSTALVYDIDLGQRDAAPGMVRWDLTLINTSRTEAASYKVYPTREDDRWWLQVNRNEGILQPKREQGRENSNHTIMVMLLTAVPMSFSGYLTIENVSNSADVKVVRVHMEVVTTFANQSQYMSIKDGQETFGLILPGGGGHQKARKSNSGAGSGRSSLPSRIASSRGRGGPGGVLRGNITPPSEAAESADTRQAQIQTLELGMLHVDRPSSEYSFVIVNHSSKSLEFVLGSNLGAGTWLTELNFSRSPGAPRRFLWSLTIPAGQEVKVYIDVVVRPSKAVGGLPAPRARSTSASNRPSSAGRARKGHQRTRSGNAASARDAAAAFVLTAAVPACKDAISPTGSTGSVDSENSILSGGSDAGAGAGARTDLNAGDHVPLTADGHRPIEVSVSCAQIRNSQRIIQLTGQVYHPTFVVETPSFDFTIAVNSDAVKSESGVVKSTVAEKKDRVFSVSPHSGFTKVASLAPGQPAMIDVQGSLEYFQYTVSACDDGNAQEVVFTPNMSALKSRLNHLLRYRYVEEHVTVYNQNRRSEKMRIHLKLKLGFHNDFNMAPRTSILQQRIGLLEAQIVFLVQRLRQCSGKRRDGRWTLTDANHAIFNEFVVIVDDLIHLGLLCEERTRGAHAVNMLHLLVNSIFGMAIFVKAGANNGAEDCDANSTCDAGGDDGMTLNNAAASRSALFGGAVGNGMSTAGELGEPDGGSGGSSRAAGSTVAISPPRSSALLTVKHPLEPWIVQFRRLLNVFYASGVGALEILYDNLSQPTSP